MLANQFDTGFAIWAEESRFLLRRPFLPDGENSIIALAGVYIAQTSDLSQRSVKNWRRTVLDNQLVIETLKLTVPEIKDELDDKFEMPLIDIRSQPPIRESSQTRCARLAILDGVSEEDTTITVGEYYLSGILGHAAHNYAVNFKPLSLIMDYARPPLYELFPNSLAFMEGATV